MARVREYDVPRGLATPRGDWEIGIRTPRAAGQEPLRWRPFADNRRWRGFPRAALGAFVLAALLLGASCSPVDLPALAPAASTPLPTAGQPRRTPLPLVATIPPTPAAVPSSTPAAADFVGRQRVRVLRVWDGQSVLVENGLTVRYLGLEAPGAGALGRPLEPLGREAALRNIELVEGKQVELELDATEVDTDGRLPRYVYVDGQLVNAELLQAGLARLKLEPANSRHEAALAEAERKAREARRGLWQTLPTPTRTPFARPALTPLPSPTSRPGTTSTPTATVAPDNLAPEGRSAPLGRTPPTQAHGDAGD